jgi:hypothetical protein
MNFQSTKIRIYLITEKFKNNKVSQPKHHCFFNQNQHQNQERKAWDLSINAIPAFTFIFARSSQRISALSGLWINHLNFPKFRAFKKT